MEKDSLRDVTFLIIIRLDSLERLENLLSVIRFLKRSFETNIHLLECDRRPNPILLKVMPRGLRYVFYQDYDPVLYRTRRLNQALGMIDTEFVSIWDADVIVPSRQVLMAVDSLRKKEYDFVYPYKTFFLDVPLFIKEQFIKTNNVNALLKNMDKMPQLYQPNPCGGAFLCDMKSYRNSGFENEGFYGWGIEDGERFSRWQDMGYRINQIPGPLFHLTHPRGLNSSSSEPSQMEILRKYKLKKLLETRKYAWSNGTVESIGG